MPIPNPPYFVHFSADPVSSATVDHSQSAPGGVATRAGHTSVSFSGKGGLTWAPETGTPRTDGMVPFYFRSVNVYFRLTDYVIQISSDYAQGSCTFNATMRHEVDEHILNPTRIMFGFRDQVIAALNRVRLPTQNAPDWVRPDQVDATEACFRRHAAGSGRVRRARPIPDGLPAMYGARMEPALTPGHHGSWNRGKSSDTIGAAISLPVSSCGGALASSGRMSISEPTYSNSPEIHSQVSG
jgi:hypothetical protein